MDKALFLRVFGWLQGLFLVVVVGAIYFRYRRDQGEIDTFSDFKSKSDAPRNPTKAGLNPLQLESQFPGWTKDTPAHEILGIAKTATFEQAEAAYKRLMKKYHPDRFARLDASHAKRAHETVLLIQRAMEVFEK